MPYLTLDGLQIPTVEELLEVETAEQRAAIDANLASGPDTVIGMLNGINASHEREAWESLQASFTAINPDAAEGAVLDAVCAISGTTRNPATKSYFRGTRKLDVTLDDLATVTIGVTKFAITATPSIRFVALETFQNTTGITDVFQIAAEAEDTGPIEAPAGTVTTIATPTTGIVAVSNPYDAVIGKAIESDEDLRSRREAELRQGGSCTTGALLSDLVAYTDESGAHPILSAVVLENKTDFTDANGVGPHAFEAVIWDGIAAAVPNLDIATIIDGDTPIGISSEGAITVTDATLDAPASFSRATQAPFEIEVTLRKDAVTYAGDMAVSAALAAVSQATQVPSDGTTGSGVIPYGRYLAAALGVAGVNRVTLIRMKFTGGSYATEDDLTMPVRSVGTLDSGDVTVISTSGL